MCCCAKNTRERSPVSQTSKAKAQRHHAKRRAFERYGLQLNRAAYQALVAQIHSGQSVCVERQSLRIAVHRVVYEQQVYHVVYDRVRKTIVTFLPKEYPAVRLCEF